MYNFNRILYLLRYLVNSRKLKKLITIILLVFALIAIYDFAHNKGYCSTTIEDATYFDGIQATYKDYEALQNDFVVRVLNYVSLNNSINTPILYTLQNILNGGYCVLFYYGDALGSQYQNTYPSVSQKNVIEVICMDASQVTSNINDYDWGLNGIQGVRGYVCATTYFETKINRANFSRVALNANTARHWLPSYLVDYKSASLVNLLELFSTGQLNKTNADALISAINNQTTEIQQQGQTITNSINETNDFLNEEVSNSVDLNIDIQPIEIDNENSQSISSLVTYFTNKLSNIVTNLNDNVQTIEIPIPHTQDRIYFQSNMISRYLTTNNFSVIYTLIQGGWWLLFGGACVSKIRRIYLWFQDRKRFRRRKIYFIYGYSA